MNEHRVLRFPEFSSLMPIRIVAAYLLRHPSWDAKKAHFLSNRSSPIHRGPFLLWSTSNTIFCSFPFGFRRHVRVACQSACGDTAAAADDGDDGVIVAQSTLSKWFMILFFCLRRRCCEQNAIAIDKMEWRVRLCVHTLLCGERCVLLLSIAREIVDIKRNDTIHHLAQVHFSWFSVTAYAILMASLHHSPTG